MFCAVFIKKNGVHSLKILYMGKQNATEAEMENVLRKVNLWEFLQTQNLLELAVDAARARA